MLSTKWPLWWHTKSVSHLLSTVTLSSYPVMVHIDSTYMNGNIRLKKKAGRVYRRLAGFIYSSYIIQHFNFFPPFSYWQQSRIMGSYL